MHPLKNHIKVDLARYPVFWQDLHTRAVNIHVVHGFEFDMETMMVVIGDLLRNEFKITSLIRETHAKIGEIYMSEEDFIWFKLRWA